MKLFKPPLFITLLFTLILSQPIGASNPAILPHKERAMVINNWLEIRQGEAERSDKSGYQINIIRHRDFSFCASYFGTSAYAMPVRFP